MTLRRAVVVAMVMVVSLTVVVCSVLGMRPSVGHGCVDVRLAHRREPQQRLAQQSHDQKCCTGTAGHVGDFTNPGNNTDLARSTWSLRLSLTLPLAQSLAMPQCLPLAQSLAMALHWNGWFQRPRRLFGLN